MRAALPPIDLDDAEAILNALVIVALASADGSHQGKNVGVADAQSLREAVDAILISLPLEKVGAVMSLIDAPKRHPLDTRG